MGLFDFDPLFRALTGREPYPWQRRLYRRFMDAPEGRDVIPDALDLPTGLGKTSVMAIWLAARINGANLPWRLIYVVDRRAVVDQATREAEGLARALDGLIAGEHGKFIRERLNLKALADVEGEETALPISTLRGQFLDNRRWFDDPASAAIVVGTVDMIGSRLLFSGYGVSRWMRPVHAALIGIDSLVVLDEAHLAPPFEAMLRGAAELIGEDVAAVEGSGPPRMEPLRVMSLSATGREREGADVFHLEDEDGADPRTAARLNAAKRVHLQDEVAAGKLAETLAGLAWSLGVGDDEAAARRVIVFCNSRRTAQEVEAALRKRAQGKDAYGKGADLTALLVGERRFAERQALADSPVFRRFMANAPACDGAMPAFLVATSAGEVGVDLDADDLVCDLVAWERMVQRLGRVNRRPEPGTARVQVVPVAGDKEAEDVIDEPRLKRLRQPFDCGAWARGPDGAFDGSPAGLIALKAVAGPILAQASTPESLRPPLTRAGVEAWSLTSLDTHTGRPKVQPWLRGWVETEPQTRVVWRRWLPLREGEAGVTGDLHDYLEDAAPPHVSEALDAPSWRVAEMLRDRAKALLKPRKGEAVSDDAPSDDAASLDRVEAPDVVEAGAGPHPLHPVVAVRLSAEGVVEHVYTLAALESVKADSLVRDIAYGTVVVDARLGGLDTGGLLDGKAGSAPLTADHQGWRLDQTSTTEWRVEAGKRPDPSRKRADGRWSLSYFRWAFSDTDDPSSLWVEVWRGPGRNSGDPAIARAAQGLEDHLTWTGGEAARIARALKLDDDHTAVLVAAAKAHDLGKARDLWQNAMGAAAGMGRPYAKTEGGGNGRALNGYRHEFGSLRDVLAAPDRYLAQQGVTEPGRVDLTLHLIASHHGRGRPTINAYDPDQLITLSPALAREAALRFARLQGRWGPWGLAWWEAALRAADWAASGALNAQPDAEADAPAEAAHG